MPLPAFAPMLASPARREVRGRGWAFEPKFDGWRALLGFDGAVSVRTRTGRDITPSVPELASPPAGLARRSFVLDGELVAGAGRPEDFYGIAGRIASRRRRDPLTFVAFDVLYLDGSPICDRPYRERRAALVALELRGPRWLTVPSFAGDIDDVFGACDALGLEGVVAKRENSLYRPGRRTTDWIKVKTTSWRAIHGPRRHEHVGAPL